MSYESAESYAFAETENTSDLPVPPDFFRFRPYRIYEVLMSDPAFVNRVSVIQDQNTGHIGIDTNDFMPAMHSAGVDMAHRVGILRILMPALSLDGFLVDLRYSEGQPRRVLNLDGTAGYDNEVASANEENKTEPVLGAIFSVPGEARLHLRSNPAHEMALRPFAVSLMKFVDAERQRRGVHVVNGSADPEVSASNSSQPV